MIPEGSRPSCQDLGRSGNLRAVKPLIRLFQNDREESMVRLVAIVALSRLGDKSAVEPLIAALQDEDPMIRAGQCSP